jgi:dihydrofolate reductase
VEKSSVIGIACIDEKGGIGKDGTLPWGKDNDDMKFFRERTEHGTVIMGGKTYFDGAMPKPLKNRLSVVITKKNYPKGFDTEDTIFLPVLDFEMIRNYFVRPILIGGATLYNQAIELKALDTFLIHTKAGDYDCDTFIDLDALNEHYAGEKVDYLVNGNELPITIYRRKI